MNLKSANDAELLWHMAMSLDSEPLQESVKIILFKCDESLISKMIGDNLPFIQGEKLKLLEFFQEISHAQKPFAWFQVVDTHIGLTESFTRNPGDVTERHQPLFRSPVIPNLSEQMEKRRDILASIELIVEQLREAKGVQTEALLDWADILEESQVKLNQLDKELSQLVS